MVNCHLTKKESVATTTCNMTNDEDSDLPGFDYGTDNFTVMGFTAANGLPVMCAVIFQGTKYNPA